MRFRLIVIRLWHADGLCSYWASFLHECLLIYTRKPVTTSNFRQQLLPIWAHGPSSRLCMSHITTFFHQVWVPISEQLLTSFDFSPLGIVVRYRHCFVLLEAFFVINLGVLSIPHVNPLIFNNSHLTRIVVIFKCSLLALLAVLNLVRWRPGLHLV